MSATHCSDCGSGPADYLCTVCKKLFCTIRGCSDSGSHHPCSEVYRTIVGPRRDPETGPGPQYKYGKWDDAISNRDLRNKLRR